MSLLSATTSQRDVVMFICDDFLFFRYWQCPKFVLYIETIRSLYILVHLLRTMTKPALMTFSNIKAINFYFNAKMTDFAMFSYRFNIWLTYCPMYMDYETRGYSLLHILLLLW